MTQRTDKAISRPEFVAMDAKVVERKSMYKGFFELEELSVRHRLFGGGWSDTFSRELFKRGHAVVVIPYDPRRDQVVLIEQFRVGALADGRSPWLLELVAGIVEEGESDEDVAHREAQEEAGCEIKALEPVCEYWVSPGGTNETIAIYCGWVDTEGVGGIHGLPHENEDIRVEVVSSEVAFAALEDGTINNAASIIALQWLQMNRSRLQQLWN